MRIFTRSPHALALIAAAVIVGCSTPKPEPVFAEVPGASANPTPVADTPAVATSSAESVPVQTSSDAQPSEESKPELIVTPDDTLTGSVVSVNDVGRFVVVRFPVGRIAAVDSKLFVYRQGLKVAELKVTGPQKDDHTVADIRTGECRVGDEVRDR